MSGILDVINDVSKKKIAIYGLGTETERFINEYGDRISVVGLLDGFREEGEIYGYPIIPLADVVFQDVQLIIVVARPGSCKAITKRIGDFCRENNIELFDVRGNDLLAEKNVKYDFAGVPGGNRQLLINKIQDAQVVSFDLFDTLITRKVYSYTDVFELLDMELRRKGIIIPDFPRHRLYAEKELSKNTAPNLTEIYRYVLKVSGGNFISAEELASMEFELDMDTMIPRDDVCKVYKTALYDGKEIVITTDSYYTLSQIQTILDRFGIDRPHKIVISCEHGTSKTQTLFDVLNIENSDRKILHIGDDEAADIMKATEYGLDTYRIYSGAALYEALGGVGLEDEIRTISDRIKVGFFISDAFNSPFWFERDNEKLSIKSTKQIGYLLCGPMITDFILWMKQRSKEEGYGQILFCARDGYLPGRLFRKVSSDIKSVYFLSSRTAAIRAGMEDEKDIEYVDSMKFFGTPEEALKTRFGIETADVEKIDRIREIINKSETQRDNYRKYIRKLNLNDDGVGMFDFVAKGTTQMYLSKLFLQHIKGFYFLQLEPEFMANKKLDIEPFYSDKEKDTSVIFDNYYILETILTSPYSQLQEFDENGEPVFADETRKQSDLDVFEEAQIGIERYFEDYIRLVPTKARIENKKLDEKMLALINHIQINDDRFMALQVEDPFFGRMTQMADLIG